MVSCLILGILLTSLYGAFSFGFNVVKLSQEEVRADQLLVDRLETLRVYDWSRITNNYVNSTFTGYFNPGATNGLSYTGSILITNAPVTQSYSNTLRQVTATVSWVSSGLTHTRSMNTFVSQNGLNTYKP